LKHLDLLGSLLVADIHCCRRSET